MSEPLESIPAELPLTLYRGDTWEVPVWVQNEDESPVNLSGCSARLEVRKERGGEVLLSLESPVGVLVDGPAGRLTLSLPAAQSAALDWQFGLYDLELTYPGGKVETLLRGRIKVEQDVTRA